MENPVSPQIAFAQFGLLLGTFPPAAIFLKLFPQVTTESGLFVMLLVVNIVCAAAGYFSGKIISSKIFEAENHSWNSMLIRLPFIGALWGIMAGGAGGLLFFFIGAFFGAFIAVVVGGIAIPVFTIFHRFLKKGEMIERKHFLPLAFGISLAAAAFILGL